jgi:YggT family protein
VILASVVLSWLLAFGIVNNTNPQVRQVGLALHRLTEPVLGPIRRFLPNLGGLDLSPIILLLALEFVRRFVIGQLVGLM